jgi:hypothetical protein
MLAVELQPLELLLDWLSKCLLFSMQCTNHHLVLSCLYYEYTPDSKLVLKNSTGYENNVGLVSNSKATHSLEMYMLFAEKIFVAINFT